MIGKPRARKWDSDSDDDSDDDSDEDVAYAHMVTDSDDATATAQTIDIECTPTQRSELHYNVPTALQATKAYECVTDNNHKVHISSIETIILDTGANVCRISVRKLGFPNRCTLAPVSKMIASIDDIWTL